MRDMQGVWGNIKEPCLAWSIRCVRGWERNKTGLRRVWGARLQELSCKEMAWSGLCFGINHFAPVAHHFSFYQRSAPYWHVPDSVLGTEGTEPVRLSSLHSLVGADTCADIILMQQNCEGYRSGWEEVWYFALGPGQMGVGGEGILGRTHGVFQETWPGFSEQIQTHRGMKQVVPPSCSFNPIQRFCSKNIRVPQFCLWMRGGKIPGVS